MKKNNWEISKFKFKYENIKLWFSQRKIYLFISTNYC